VRPSQGGVDRFRLGSSSLEHEIQRSGWNVLILVAIGGDIVTSALAEPVWPFSLFCVVGGATYLVGLVI
jgi:hypothetical protein